ncbi:hypothetical protein EVG20_g5880 [Dentipellis fragilis]|uniref:Structural maintenance of chromosomes protein 4 n=1 Tax=Dentipellis fragilis TaxID=205917 RepID=A0A4Y9YSA9_9AGAM|nr:hypothetical protein EVG20_g5880 [Dentipellis fragilis]
MPPRRSTRSRGASVDPAPAEKLAPKRKRTQAAEESNTSIEEQENIPKPASRSRRSTSAQPSASTRATRTRTSTRSGSSTLRQVQESDEEQEEEESPRPVKKSRPSPEVEEFDDEEEDVKPPVPKTKRGPPKRGKKPEPEVIVLDDSDDEAPPPPPAPKGRKPSSRRSSAAPPSAPSTSRATGRTSRTASRTVKAEPVAEERIVEEEEEDKEPPKPASKGKAAPKRSKKKAVETSEEEEAGADAPSAAEEMVPDSDQEEMKDTVPAPKSASASPVAAPAAEFGEPYEEEEKSLLDPPELSQLKSQPPPPEEPQGPKSRLMIHQMALVNFKSYAGRQEIGPFHKSFSAIVGPNGSGKSNTIDALLFVFGYRASKMRQGKLSELIHNSAQYPDLDDCSVEVHFREIVDLPGPDAFEVVPDSTLVVARTAYKNNSSKYTINGRQSNYKEVQTLLKDRGIDLDHNRFLILQGEVESISQMKPKAPSEHEDGLLEYLEDIVGTSKYKEPIELSLVEMERLSEERSEKLNRLRIVEKEKNKLEEQKREAEDYLRLHNEHVRALSRLYQFYLWNVLVVEEKNGKKKAKLEKDLAEERERNKDDIAHLKELEQHYEKRVKAYEEVKAAAAIAIKDLANHEKQEVGLEERRKHANSKVKKLNKSLQEDEHARSEALRAIDDNTEKMEKERQNVEELEESLEKEEKMLEKIRDSLKDKTQVFHDQIEQKQKELQPWTAKINKKQAEFDVKTSERDMLVKKAEAVKQAMAEANEALQKLQADQEAKTSELDDLRERKAGLQNQIKAGQKQLSDTQARVHDLRTQASSSRQRVDEARASQASNTSQNRVLDGLTRLKNAGRITGFHGRLGSLGTIPDKYDVAVTTACGQLNNMVVDTVEQGQSCIEYLRKQNIGRASFMVLEKLTRPNIDRGPTPEGVPRLFDLIKPKDPRFAPAFARATSNTLVADNLEQANRIAFGSGRRCRVVTLQGQLIDASGTMSGGGNHVSRGGMSSKLQSDAVSPEELKRFEHDSAEAGRKLEQAQQELRQVETQLDSLMRSGPEIALAEDKVNLDIRNGAKRIAEAEKRVRELKAQSKPDAIDVARITALEREIDAASQELEELQERTGSIEEDIKALEKRILDIGGAKMLKQKSTVDGIKLHINLANDEITKAEVAKAKAEKDSVKLANAIESNESSLKEVEDELAGLVEQLEGVAETVAAIRAKVETAQSAVEHSKDDLEELKTALDEKNEEVQAFRNKERELTQDLENVLKEIEENDRKVEHWQKLHDELKVEDIDDDEEEEEEQQEPGETSGKKKRGSALPPNVLHAYTAEQLSRFKRQELIADAELLDEKLKNARPNLGVLKEYRKREEEFLRRARDLDDTTSLRDAEKQKYDDLRKQRLDEFMAGFNAISLKLKEMYQMITLGGNAELELVDSMDPFSEGIIFSVMPPKKSWRNISNLSGGEKTLSSLALVFALHVFKPTPLYFMDEIDAALDFRNVSIVANYIKDRTKNAQFIIISLRNDMFELSHRLIGIYKTSNQTRSISIDNRDLHVLRNPSVNTQ